MATDTYEYPNGIAHLLPPVHPGSVLADEMKARKLSANALARDLHLAPNRISDIRRGRRAISPETALRLGRYFGTGGQFWLNLQAQHDLAVAERELGEQIDREIRLRA